MQRTDLSKTHLEVPVTNTIKIRKTGFATALLTASLMVFSTNAKSGGDPDDLFDGNDTAVLDSSDTAIKSPTLGAGVEDIGDVSDGVRVNADGSPATEAAAETEATMGTFMRDAASRVGAALTPSQAVPTLIHDRASGYVSDKAFSLNYVRSTEKYGVGQGRIDAGFLFTEERDIAFQLGFAIDTSFLTNVRLSFGARGYLILLGSENDDAFSLGLGVEGAYQLPIRRLPLTLAASLYFAPDVTTFGTGERLFDGNIDVILPVRSNFDVFVGFRFFRLDLRPGDRDLDDEIHAGLRYTFR